MAKKHANFSTRPVKIRSELLHHYAM